MFLSILSTIKSGYTHGDTNHTSCAFLEEEGYSWPAFQIAFFSSSYVVPLVLISGLYLRMLLRLWRHGVGGRISAESQRGRKRVTRMVVIVVAAFASLWFPIQTGKKYWRIGKS
ncbi:G protein-coupled receptor, rhodopsin-like [Sergentomyia squamirostris]